MMKSFPLFAVLRGRRVVIAGGGEEAVRKAALFGRAKADLVVVAADIDRAAFEAAGVQARFVARDAEPEDFAGAFIVVVADAGDAYAEALARTARAAGALVNVVDRPALCDFTTPSIVDRGDVVVAISTNGTAPVLGAKLRAVVEAAAPPRLGALAAFAGSFRDAVAAAVPKASRRRFWTTFFRGPIAAQVLAGDEPGARDAMIAAVNAPDAGAPAGVVHIVGAGPGDPDLLTLRAHRLLQEADVIFYDRLVGDGVLDLARRDAERVFVGKAKADHAVPQRDIEAMMIARARAGDVVVRLKGGDPYVFGRGGEEREAMLAAGVDVTVTPGVTAAVGCAASVGAPLTHRDDAQAVTFVTGHAAGDADPDLDWGALAALGHTLVVYMGVTKAGRIAERLIAHGSDPTTPVAVVENGTRATEKVVPGRLADLEALIDAHAIAGPAVLIIGAVAARADAARRLAEEAAFSERAVA